GNNGRPRLHRASLRASYDIALSAGAASLVDRDGKSLRIVPRCLAGCVDEVRRADGCLEVAGWAADVKSREVAESILVFADGRLLYTGRPNAIRTDVAEKLGEPRLERAGFSFALPLEWLQGREDAPLRVFATSRRGEACELSRQRGR